MVNRDNQKHNVIDLFTLRWAFLLCVLAFGFTGCYYDNEAFLYGTQDCDLETPVSYADFVAPVLALNCNVCHNTDIASAGVITDTYEGVNEIANSGLLYGVITHADGFSEMPKNADKLDDCTINKIKLWIDDGAQNN